MKVNRRRLLSIIGVSPALLAGSSALARTEKTCSAEEPFSASGHVRITALNPHGMPSTTKLIPMAPRLKTLDGKTVYLVSDGFPGADHFLDQIRIWFAKNMPSVKTVYRPKAGEFSYVDSETPKRKTSLPPGPSGAQWSRSHHRRSNCRCFRPRPVDRRTAHG